MLIGGIFNLPLAHQALVNQPVAANVTPDQMQQRCAKHPADEADPHDAEHDDVGGRAQQRREHLAAPQLEQGLVADAGPDSEQHHVEQCDGERHVQEDERQKGEDLQDA